MAKNKPSPYNVINLQEYDSQRPLIQVRKLVKTYKSVAGEFTVLKGIDADLYAGEFIGVIGRSGSGKSTLVNMLTGIDRPTSGEVLVGGVEVNKLSEGQLAAWRGLNVGIVFQFFQLLPTLTLLENIMLPMDFCHRYSLRQRRLRALELLKLVELEEHAYKLPSSISGGQQQRVAIARALANDPPIVFADEPTGNLDSKTAETVFHLFDGLVAQGKTIIMVTHDTTLAKLVKRTVLLADGEIVNNWVFRALPTLSPDLMLKATKEIEVLRFNPGQPVIQQGQPSNNFYIITSGGVEVVFRQADGSEIVITHMDPTQYFGEIELVQDRSAIATVRAGESGVEVIALDHQEFEQLLAESDVTRQAIADVVRKRTDENIEARGGQS